MMSKLLYSLNNQWHMVSCFLRHPWTQISKFCFIRLPELSKLVFCNWSRGLSWQEWNDTFQPFVQTDQRGQSPEVVSYETFIIIIRVYQLVCIDSWQRNPSLGWSHRCRQYLANLDHTGPNCHVRSFLHLLFGRPCLLVHSLGVHSVLFWWSNGYQIAGQCDLPIYALLSW